MQECKESLTLINKLPQFCAVTRHSKQCNNLHCVHIVPRFPPPPSFPSLLPPPFLSSLSHLILPSFPCASQVISQADPDLVALHCQEIGGKDFEIQMPKVTEFVRYDVTISPSLPPFSLSLSLPPLYLSFSLPPPPFLPLSLPPLYL